MEYYLNRVFGENVPLSLIYELVRNLSATDEALIETFWIMPVNQLSVIVHLQIYHNGRIVSLFVCILLFLAFKYIAL